MSNETRLPENSKKLLVPIDISVVIPTFRRPKPLAEALASVLAQSGVSIEVFVVDDSPEGSAREVVEKIGDKRVSYLKNPKPTGGYPSVVRNLAWPHTQGEFVHFLDDDDIVPDGHYQAVKEAFSQHPQIGLIFGRIEPFGDAPSEQLQHEREYWAAAAKRAQLCAKFGSKWAFAAQMLFDFTLLVCSDGIVRRDCVVALGGFDPQIRLVEDVEFYTRVIRYSGAYFMDRVALRFRISFPSLFHNSVELSEKQWAELREARKRQHAKYRAQHNLFEFYLLRLFARSLRAL